MQIPRFLSLLAAVAYLLASTARAQDEAEAATFAHQADVIYGHKYGLALTMDIFRPKADANGLGVIFVVSGGWFSDHAPDGQRFTYLLDRGYTVFAVVHGSNPKFSIPEVLEDMHAAVRFIRFHAAELEIDPNQIGITGASAGGHLSLMQGVAGDYGDPKAKSHLDRISSRVQAVACFFPPTDFLNYGRTGENAIGRGVLWNYSGAFDFRVYDPYWRKLVPVTDEAKIEEIGREISPVNHVSSDSPPTLIIHGDKDWLVPIQQSELIVEKLKAAGVEAKLIVKHGAEHGWADMNPEWSQIADWFDSHLTRPVAPAAPPK